MIWRALRISLIVLTAATLVAAVTSYFVEPVPYFHSRPRFCLRWYLDDGAVRFNYDGGSDVIAANTAERSYLVISYDAENTRGWQFIRASVSLWLIGGLFSVYPGVSALRLALRQRRRRRLGMCLACGYDLKGSVSGICSECGTPAAR